MIDRRIAVTALVAAFWLGACASEPPPPPEPTGPSAEELARQDSIRRAEQARQDSIRRAEQARQDSIQRVREATAAARANLEEMVFFDFDESSITPAAERVLRQKVEILRNSPAVRLRIEGHADERGSTEYNMALGNRRAESVREFFVGFGLDPNRFSIVSYGEERPLVNQSNEQAWERNRRAEFVITAGQDQINPVMEP